jgi:hypothetical protein
LFNTHFTINAAYFYSFFFDKRSLNLISDFLISGKKMNKFSFLQFAFLIITLITIQIIPQGKVYLVLGSDTAIWDGMSVSNFQSTYNLDLFTSPSSNTSVVMSEAFRDQIRDSYGNTFKFTWWMMAGNIFRYATNNNIPINNTMTLHLMKKYFGNKVELWGDELSLHYHTFNWTDYSGDGKYWWNQAQTFLETKDDFDYTLAQFLLEENVFPVSFRSGWHYMDNDWQAYLNELLPYSLHNDWPHKHVDELEPIDNNYDWSLSSPEFIPFNPSAENYQLAGDGKGWNVRSVYMGSVSQQLMNQIFQKANQGIDQIVCLWSHLPDTRFVNEILQVNDAAQLAAENYPNVKFQYSTAIEAYQQWLQYGDSLKPELELTEEISGSDVKFLITTNEPIFQSQPFVAVKDRYERYIIAQCENISENMWRTVSSFSVNDLAKVGAAVTDTVGNLSTEFIYYLEDDQFIDNGDDQHIEVFGSWSTSSISAWNLDSRISNLNSGDSAKVRWMLEPGSDGPYNIFVQFPSIQNHIDTIHFEIYKNGVAEELKTIILSNNFKQWIYAATIDLNTNENNFIEMSAINNQQSSKVFFADVLKISAYVRDRQISSGSSVIELGEVSIEDSITFSVEISNIGISDLNISNIFSPKNSVKSITPLPITISRMKKQEIELTYFPTELGSINDTLVIQSDDPVNPYYKIPLIGLIQKYFRILDNEDAGIYSEIGTWFTSVAQAYGSSSRYAPLQSEVNGPSAEFSFQLLKSGYYDIFEIVPQTVNAANNAFYKIMLNGAAVDSFYANQNLGSGVWKKLGRYFFPAETQIKIKITDTGESTAGEVIRADAFKIALFDETTDLQNDLSSLPDEYNLYQNYPNPFNPATTIKWELKAAGHVFLKIFNILGQEVAVLIDEIKPAGKYIEYFDASELPSGVYIYMLSSGDFVSSRKMMLLK